MPEAHQIYTIVKTNRVANKASPQICQRQRCLVQVRVTLADTDKFEGCLLTDLRALLAYRSWTLATDMLSVISTLAVMTSCRASCTAAGSIDAANDGDKEAAEELIGPLLHL